jgi:hypothetical protein
MPITAKSSPSFETVISKGDYPLVFSKNLKIAYGFLKISFGPTNPLIALLIHMIAASVVMAAEAPLESLSCFPALIALHGM